MEVLIRCKDRCQKKLDKILRCFFGFISGTLVQGQHFGSSSLLTLGRFGSVGQLHIMGSVISTLSLEARRRFSRPSFLVECRHGMARYQRS
ncbi:Kv channel interacting protein 3a, calsenilin isoform X5, partial [Tachysurus ichikawai]